jgi:hypothetical protein
MLATLAGLSRDFPTDVSNMLRDMLACRSSDSHGGVLGTITESHGCKAMAEGEEYCVEGAMDNEGEM